MGGCEGWVGAEDVSERVRVSKGVFQSVSKDVKG